MKTNIFNFNFWTIWTIFVFFYIVISYLTNIYIFTDSFYLNTLSKDIDFKSILKVIAFQKKFQYVGFTLIPVVLLLKLLIVAGVLFTGIYLFDIHVKYINCLKIVLIAEVVSIAAMLIRTVWLIIKIPETTKELEYFSPLSITQLLNLDKVPSYLIYPLQLINIFEIAFWMVLAYGIMSFTKQDWTKSLKIVASSYGVALLIWVIFIVFIQVQFT